MKKLPQLVELHKKFKDKQFKLITVCVDEPKQYDQALKTLKSQSAGMTNWWVENGKEHEDEIVTEWGFNAVYPAVYVFDQSGKKVLDNIENPDLTVEGIEKKVVTLLDAG